MPSFAEKQTRLKDEFFLVAQARPATADHYLAWLESYIDAGGALKGLSLDPFPKARFFTISHDAATPTLDGAFAVNVIVPPGVTLSLPSGSTDCVTYDVDSGSFRGSAEIYIWREMLDGAIKDGYPLSKLVSKPDMGRCVQAAVIEKVTGHMAGGNDFYESFADQADLAKVEGYIAKLQASDVTQITRDFFALEAATPIDAASQAVIDEKAREAMKTFEILRYKLDPASAEPIPAFGKRAKPPAPPPEPNIGLPDQIQVGPVLRLKDPGSP